MKNLEASYFPNKLKYLLKPSFQSITFAGTWHGQEVVFPTKLGVGGGARGEGRGGGLRGIHFLLPVDSFLLTSHSHSRHCQDRHTEWIRSKLIF